MNDMSRQNGFDVFSVKLCRPLPKVMTFTLGSAPRGLYGEGGDGYKTGRGASQILPL